MTKRYIGMVADDRFPIDHPDRHRPTRSVMESPEGWRPENRPKKNPEIAVDEIRELVLERRVWRGHGADAAHEYRPSPTFIAMMETA